MNGSNHALNSLIKELRERVKDLEKKVEVQQDRADEWMTLYMELEDENKKLKELIKPKKKSDENN
jgi:hypothetical protein|tara:strand:+ start:1007 stop:1201 length:195 start_codon:yes stop_codon:yes gene_type:complete